MKKFQRTCLFFILILSEAKSQTFFQGYDLFARDNFSSGGRLIKTSDGNLILACIQRNCLTLDILGIAISKFDYDGNVIWTKQIKSDRIPLETDIVQTSDDGYAIAFTAYDTSAIDSNMYEYYIGIIKLNPDAEIEWYNVIQDIRDANNPRILQVGHSLFVCYTGFQGAFHLKMNLMKFSMEGNLLFYKQFSNGNANSFWGGIVVNTDQSLIATGTYSDSATATNGMFKFVIDTLGNSLNCETYSGDYTNYTRSCIIDAAGNFVFVGTQSTLYGTFGKLNPSGDVVFFKKIEFGANYDELWDIVQAPDNSYYVLAEPESYINKSQVGLLKFDEQGNFLWMKIYGRSEGSFPFNEVLNNDGSITVAGIQATVNQSADIYLLRVDSNGNANCFSENKTPIVEDLILNVGTGCNEKDVTSGGTASLTEYCIDVIAYSACDTTNSNTQCDTTNSTFPCDTVNSLGDFNIISNSLQVFPNPTTSSLQLHCTLSQPGELIMFDALGRKVKSYTLPSTQNTFELSVAELPAGVYLVAVKIEGKWWREKLIKE